MMLALLAFLVNETHATTVVTETIQQRIDRSTVVMEGTVTQLVPNWTPDGEPVQDVSVRVDDTLIGGITSGEVQLRTPGGNFKDGTPLRGIEDLRLTAGAHVLIFGKRRSESSILLTGWTQGLFHRGMRGSTPIALDALGRPIAVVECGELPQVVFPIAKIPVSETNDGPEPEIPADALFSDDPQSLAMEWSDFVATISSCVSQSTNNGAILSGSKQ